MYQYKYVTCILNLSYSSQSEIIIDESRNMYLLKNLLPPNKTTKKQFTYGIDQ